MALTKVTKELLDGDLTISGGTVDNSVIGGSTAAAGSFTTLQGTTVTATTAFVPDASDGAALGTTSLEFSDLFLADGAVINLGDDQDTTLTHVADTGILLNSTRQLQFGDSGTYIHQSADGVLDLVSDTEIELNATTIDINGAVDVSGEIAAASLDISGNVDIDGTLEADGITSNGVAVKVAGKETIWVPATAMYPNTTNGCSELTQVELANGPELKCLDFAGGGTEESAQFTVAFPKSWNESTITFQVFWTSSASGTEGVSWGLQGIGIADDASLNSTFSQAGVVVDDTKTAANDLLVSPESNDVTIPNAAVDTLTIFQIYRDTDDTNDTDTSNDARLLGVKLFFTTNAANDA
jgi:hypothetical protein